MKFFTCLVLMFISITTQAAESPDTSQASLINLYYNALKGQKLNLTNHGYVCEEIAKLDVMEEFDQDTYNVYNGIIYQQGNRVLGELDIVVTRKSDGEAVMVAEVKCKSRLRAALNLAHKQLNRFFYHVDHSLLDIHHGQRANLDFYTDNFDEEPEMRTISHLHSVNSGFDQELVLSLDSVKVLQRKLRCYPSRC